ncbi:hypothetical protein ColTof3_08274 [Colletotrichum tofieldiae]|nr:hypothetical protein ColTof3_08274 [Colletotrichum tofieldiae]
MRPLHASRWAVLGRGVETSAIIRASIVRTLIGVALARPLGGPRSWRRPSLPTPSCSVLPPTAQDSIPPRRPEYTSQCDASIGV